MPRIVPHIFVNGIYKILWKGIQPEAKPLKHSATKPQPKPFTAEDAESAERRREMQNKKRCHSLEDFKFKI
jgi:hypothetical protein